MRPSQSSAESFVDEGARGCLALIEDNVADAALVTALLSHTQLRGLRLECFTRLDEALPALRRPDVACVLLDLALPDACGLEALVPVTAAAPDVPLVILTGNTDAELATRALGEGAQDFLIKGAFDAAALERSIRYAIHRKQAQRELAARERLSQSILNALDAHTAVLDASGRILQVNDRWTAFGRANGADEARIGVGVNYIDVCRAAAATDAHDAPIAALVADAICDVTSGRRQTFEIEYPGDSPDETRWFLLRVSALPDVGAVVTHTPITQQMQTQLQFEHQALHDALTGLPNRVALLDRLQHELSQRDSRLVAVLFIDLDGFKAINDDLGHAVGDALLKEVATRLLSVTRTGDIVCRLGGDELVVVARVDDQQQARGCAERLHAALAPPTVIGGREVTVGATIGIAFADTGSAPDDVLDAADVTMLRGKRERRGRTYLAGERMRDPVASSTTRGIA